MAVVPLVSSPKKEIVSGEEKKKKKAGCRFGN